MTLFGAKAAPPVPIVNPSDTANRMNDAMARKLAAGGTNADQTSSNVMAPVGPSPMGRLTGLN